MVIDLVKQPLFASKFDMKYVIKSLAPSFANDTDDPECHPAYLDYRHSK
jgi:hypothetical protein